MASIEETLMQELRFGGIGEENLRDLVGIVAGIQKGGLKRLKVLPKGTPPIVDSLSVSGVLDAGEVAGFFNQILTKTARLNEVVLFPIGIPWPDVFRVNITVGNPVMTEQGFGP